MRGTGNREQGTGKAALGLLALPWRFAKLGWYALRIQRLKRQIEREGVRTFSGGER